MKIKEKELKELVKLLDGIFDETAPEKSDEDDINALCAAAVKKFGVGCQVMKAIEELLELQRALVRFIVWSDGEKGGRSEGNALLKNIHEEMADVLIMNIQLEKIFGHDADLIDAKIEHLRGLVEA